jgi:hypothetical protein
LEEMLSPANQLSPGDSKPASSESAGEK